MHFVVSWGIVVLVMEKIAAYRDEYNFLAFFSKEWPSLTLVSLVWSHEMGHRLALFLNNIPAVGPILLVPIGGIMVPKMKLDPEQEFLVSLSGPLTGIIGTVAIVVGMTNYSGYLVGLGMFWSLINFVNLIPLGPLDGGVILGDILTAINPKLKWVPMLIGAVLLVAIVVIKPETWVPTAITVGVLWTVDVVIVKFFNINYVNPKKNRMDRVNAVGGALIYLSVFAILGAGLYLASKYFGLL
jgi:hypothetical protein